MNRFIQRILPVEEKVEPKKISNVINEAIKKLNEKKSI
jgi:hypothetical protein